MAVLEVIQLEGIAQTKMAVLVEAEQAILAMSPLVEAVILAAEVGAITRVATLPEAVDTVAAGAPTSLALRQTSPNNQKPTLATAK